VIAPGFSGPKTGTWRECDHGQPAIIPALVAPEQFWSGRMGTGPGNECRHGYSPRRGKALRADWSEFEDHMDTLLGARLTLGNGPAGPAARLRSATGPLGGSAWASADTYSVADGEAAHGRA
jgi:hypothetical protein